MAPELMKCESYDTTADWWSYGCIIYEMLYGKTPFHDPEKKVTNIMHKVRNNEVEFPNVVKCSDEAKDIIKQLLIKDPSKRLG